MAVRYKDLYDKEIARPLSGVEKASIDATETYIDNLISTTWDSRTSAGTIYVPLCYAHFTCYANGTRTDYNDITREKMFKILEQRYKDADWNCKVEIDNSGSMNECDYWVLTPKRK